MTEEHTDPEPSPRRRKHWLKWLARRLSPYQSIASDEEVAEALRARSENGEIADLSRHDMVLKALHFDRLKVNDVMRPRADIVAIDAQATLGEAARLFSESQHSRLPIYRDILDDPAGFVHVRDVMSQLAPDENGESKGKFADRTLMRIKRDILFVPPSMRLSALFLKMQSSRIHLALVVDEYGGTDGIVSMEDLVEQIVGDIDDEHDEETALIQERVGGFEAEGRAEVEKLEQALGVSLQLPEHEDEFDTAAGLAVALAGRLPQRGEILRHPAGYDIEILEADPRRVRRLRFRRASPDATGPDEKGDNARRAGDAPTSLDEIRAARARA